MPAEVPLPRYPPAQNGDAVRALGHLESECPGGAALNGTQLVPNTSTRYGPFSPGALIEFEIRDAGNLVAGTAEDIHFNPGDSTVTATASNRPRKTSVWPVFRVHLKPNQTHVALISAAAGAKTHNVYITFPR